MLSSSTLSRQTDLSSALSESVDLDLVEQIIERAPRSATSFPLIYRAYGEVLEENGLSPSTDTAYYQFLLKLGIIRAPTWGERWDQWRATQTSTRPSPRFPPVDESKIAESRARLPFLASASSDLDEGFGGSETYEGDGESLLNVLRVSPRKAMTRSDRSRARSLVGYTPSQSVDYGDTSFNPPMRTSTPVYAQEYAYGPPLPPYSVSDLSRSDVFDRSATPKAGVVSWNEGKSMEEWVTEEMERKADEFYRTGLLGRCWDVWAGSNQWIQRTAEQIDNVRNNILLRQSLKKWHDAHERLLELPGTADAHRAHHLQMQVLRIWMRRLKNVQLVKKENAFLARTESGLTRGSWTKWRTKLISRRTDRWQRDMRTKEKGFVRDKDGMLLRNCFYSWHDQARSRSDSRKADAFFDRSIQRTTFYSWFDATTKKVDLVRRLDDYVLSRDSDTLAICFSLWRVKALELEAERRVLRRIWEQWRITKWRSEQARAFLDRHEVKRAMEHWKARMKLFRIMEGKAVMFCNRREKILLRSTFEIWAIHERGQLLVRVKENRLLAKCLGSFKRKIDHLNIMRETAVAHHLTLEKRTVHRTFSRWKDRQAQHLNRALQADLVYENNIVAKTINKWSVAIRKIRADRVTADKAHAFFLLRQALMVWKAGLARKRQVEWCEKRQVEEMRGVFALWRDATKESVREKQEIRVFRGVQDKRLLAWTLSIWTERVVEVKSRELDVVERRDAGILRDGLTRWIIASKRVQEVKSLMQSFVDVKIEDHLRHVLRVWRNQAKTQRERRVESEKRAREKDQRLLQNAFEVWYSRHRERSLVEAERETALRHEDAILFAVWDKWRARSQLLPCISFANRRVKKLGWSRWRKALKSLRHERAAEAPRNRRLLEEAFDIWRDAHQHRVAAKAARMRARIRPVDTARRVASAPNAPNAPRRATPTTTNFPRAVPQPRPIPPEPQTRHMSSESVVSEPAYSRLRSELVARRRGGSDEPEERPFIRTASRSDLVQALWGNLPSR